MNVKKYIPGAVTRTVNRTLLKAGKSSPNILFAVGVAGVGVGTVLACRATLKLNGTLDEIQKDLHNVKELDGANGTDNYQRDLAYVYGKAAVKVVRLYGPAVLVGAGGIACLVGSHRQLTARNNALMGAYAALETAYNNYRERVRAEVGEDRELELYQGIYESAEKDHIGKLVVDPSKLSPYARFFDQLCGPWESDPECNKIFLQAQQNYMNYRLQAKGHLFLNEVYEALGMDPSRTGQVVGWLRDGEGDNFVDFGIFDVYNSRFVNNAEPSILLDFNVNGVIWDKI